MKPLVVVGLLLLHQVLGDVSQELISRASNHFANKLYQEIGKEPGNVLVCPFSAHVALGLLHQGASGNTASELATVLSLTGSNEDIKGSYKALLTTVQDKALKVATKLYPAENFKISPDYVSLAQNYFLSEVESINFGQAAEAAAKINKYVEDKTNNTIHDLISADSLSDLTKLVIVNAVYFKATWKIPFSTSYDGYFKITPEKKIDSKMMTKTDYFGYKEDADLEAQVLKMDYKEGGYSMIIILPNKEDGMPALDAKLANTTLQAILANVEPTNVAVTIPKFKLEKTIDLKSVLGKVGLQDVFTARADLSKVSSGWENLYVSEVIQKTFIKVDEEGTEASAATGIFAVFLSAVEYYPPPKPFNADRPFFFSIIRNSDTVLFNGRLHQP